MRESPYLDTRCYDFVVAGTADPMDWMWRNPGAMDLSTRMKFLGYVQLDMARLEGGIDPAVIAELLLQQEIPPIRNLSRLFTSNSPVTPPGPRRANE